MEVSLLWSKENSIMIHWIWPHRKFGEKKCKVILTILDNLDMLLAELSAVMPEITTLFLCASAAGGTGSGMFPALAEIISKEIRINVCPVTVIPDKSENFQSYANTVEVFQEIEKLDCTGAVFILDNSRNPDKMKINDIFYTHLAALLANENGSDYGCLDRSEIDKLLETSNMAVMSKLGKNKGKQLVESLTENNIYARIEADKIIKYIGMISCEKKCVHRSADFQGRNTY